MHICSEGVERRAGIKKVRVLSRAWHERNTVQYGKAECVPSRVGIPLHDDSLDLGNTAMITGRRNRGCHLGNTQCNGLSLSCHEDNLHTKQCMSATSFFIFAFLIWAAELHVALCTCTWGNAYALDLVSGTKASTERYRHDKHDCCITG